MEEGSSLNIREYNAKATKQNVGRMPGAEPKSSLSVQRIFKNGRVSDSLSPNPRNRREFSKQRLYDQSIFENSKVLLVAPYLSARDLLIDRLGAQGAGKSQAYALSPADDQLVRPDGFINAADSLYLKHYAIEHLIELISREHLNRFDCMYQYKQNINRK
jgi:hypothetical protein